MAVQNNWGGGDSNLKREDLILDLLTIATNKWEKLGGKRNISIRQKETVC